MNSITLTELVAICKRYSDLGGAIQAQIDDTVLAVSLGSQNGQDELNENAVSYILEWLSFLKPHFPDDDDIQIDIDDALEWLSKEAVDA